MAIFDIYGLLQNFELSAIGIKLVRETVWSSTNMYTHI